MSPLLICFFALRFCALVGSGEHYDLIQLPLPAFALERRFSGSSCRQIGDDHEFSLYARSPYSAGYLNQST
jgi:hypothetical protein